MNRLLASTLFAVGLAAWLPALAADYKLGAIEIGQPWSRATPPTAPAGAGFLTVINKGEAPDRLIAVETPVAGKVEIHEMKMEDNIMRMREVEGGLVLPPGQTVELRPGGYHLMFMGLKEPFAKDQRVPATLVFEKAGRLQVEFKVEALGASGPAAGHHKH
jgi:periplasmic copper chaperone A